MYYNTGTAVDFWNTHISHKFMKTQKTQRHILGTFAFSVAPTFCHLWWSRRWPRDLQHHAAGLPVTGQNPGLQRWCCLASTWIAHPFWWRLWACARRRWCPPTSAARSRWDLNSNREEMYGLKVNDGAARRCSRGMHKTSYAVQEIKDGRCWIFGIRVERRLGKKWINIPQGGNIRTSLTQSY